MAVPDINRQKKTPATGADAGNLAIVDSNLKITDRLAIPSSDENTFNGGKAEDGVIKLSLNAEGDLILNSYADGKWTEYLAVLDGLKSIGGITLDENEVTVVAPVKWRINSVNYEKLTNTVITVNSATDGFKRIDYIYANTNGNVLLIEGTEVADGNPYIPPILPVNTVMVAPVYISGDTVQQPIPDLSIYLTRVQADNLYIKASPETPQDAFILLNRTENGSGLRINDSSTGAYSTINSTGITVGGGTQLQWFDNVYSRLTYQQGNIDFKRNSDDATISINGIEINRNSDDAKVLWEGDALPISGGQVTGKITGSSLFEVTDPKDYVQAGNVVAKQQYVIYLSDFTDTYTGIDPLTGHNEGSAIVKAYNSITDTTKHYTIYFDNNKTYFPTGFTLEGGSYWKKPNISFIGTKPRYAQDGKSLVSGTVILGTFALFANNLYFDGLGIDVGFTYSANYGFDNGTEAFIPCFNPEQSETVERTNITVKNIITLCKPNALYHGFSLEFANGAVVDNVTTLYGYHGQVIKSKNVLYTNGFAYGHHGEGLVVKSDAYAVSSNVSVDGLIVDVLPYGVEFFETVIHRMGVLINPATDQMYNIKINNITVNNYQQGIMAFGGYNVNGLQIDNLFGNNCNMLMSNELISGVNVQIGKISGIGTGGSAFGYRQIDGNYTTTIQSISLKNVPYGMSVPNGNVYVETYVHEDGIGAFDISGAGHIYLGTTKLTNLTARNVGTSVDEPLPQFAGIGIGIMKNNSNGIPSIAVAGTDYVVPSTINNYLPKTAGSSNALTGPLYIDRASTSLGSQIILSTLLAPDWYFGTDIAGSGTKSDFSLYNFGAGNAFNISKATNAVSFPFLAGTGNRPVSAAADGTLIIGNPDASVGVTINSTATSLALTDRGYYNFIGSSNSIWTLPSVTGIAGRFYRIYNKASDGTSKLTINPNGSNKLFRGGTLLTTIELNYGENLTLVCDGIDFNVYN